MVLNAISLIAGLIAITGLLISLTSFKDHPQKNFIQILSVVILFIGFGGFIINDELLESEPLIERVDTIKNKHIVVIQKDTVFIPGEKIENRTNNDNSIDRRQNEVEEPRKSEVQENDFWDLELVIGEWRGEMVQSNGNKNLTTVILKIDNSGNLVGRIDHPNMNCGGELELISKTGRELLFFQRKLYGGSNCASGRTKIVFSNNSRMTRIWYNPNSGREVARGEFEKM